MLPNWFTMCTEHAGPVCLCWRRLGPCRTLLGHIAECMALRWVVSAYVGLILADVGPRLGHVEQCCASVGFILLHFRPRWHHIRLILSNFWIFSGIRWPWLGHFLVVEVSSCWPVLILDFGHLKVVESWPCRLYFGFGHCILGPCKVFAKKRSKHKGKKWLCCWCCSRYV